MDIELQQAQGQLRMALMCLQARDKRLRLMRSKWSRHYTRISHTKAMIGLLEELLGVVMQDPDVWDDEPDIVPF